MYVFMIYSFNKEKKKKVGNYFLLTLKYSFGAVNIFILFYFLDQVMLVLALLVVSSVLARPNSKSPMFMQHK